MTEILRHPALTRFSCLGDQCPDTCCKGWSMQLDAGMHEKYEREAPELLDAVEAASEAPWIMRKDPGTSYCVKFEGGLCGIHKHYGDAFLGDACHFYPRSTRALGEATLMTAALSCPEVARLALFEASPLVFETVETDRLPHSLKDYLPHDLSSEQALSVHQAFLRACEDEAGAEKIFARIASASRSLALIDIKSWPQAAAFYLTHADSRLPEPASDINDPFNLLHALAGLIVATQKPMSERLAETVSDMERSLGVRLDWKNVLIHTSADSLPAYWQMQERWSTREIYFQPILKRYLQMQLSLALFPFSGLGVTLPERATILGVRLATVKLALMTDPDASEEKIVRIIQSLSRFLDHLGDPTFSLAIYKETGWDKENRMMGLLAEA